MKPTPFLRSAAEMIFDLLNVFILFLISTETQAEGNAKRKDCMKQFSLDPRIGVKNEATETAFYIHT